MSKSLKLTLDVEKLINSVKYDNEEIIDRGKRGEFSYKTFTFQPEPIQISEGMVEDIIKTSIERDPDSFSEMLVDGRYSLKDIVKSILENSIDDVYDRDYRGYGSDVEELDIEWECQDEKEVKELTDKFKKFKV